MQPMAFRHLPTACTLPPQNLPCQPRCLRWRSRPAHPRRPACRPSRRASARPAGSPSTTPGSSQPPPAFMPPVEFPTPPPGQARPGLWCVANPKAGSAVVQTAMECGSGADCGVASPGGPCYLPDTLVTHASYAFNSYWQRTKAAGGTCDFAGAAMLVTRDPSKCLAASCLARACCKFQFCLGVHVNYLGPKAMRPIEVGLHTARKSRGPI